MDAVIASDPRRILLLAFALACGSLLAPALAADGPEIYGAQCAQCHQPDGEGLGTFPALAGSDRVLGDMRELVAFVLDGQGAMPAFRDVLDDEELAAVLSHVRESFGNEAEPIETDLVADVRAEAGTETETEPVEVDLPEDWFEQGEQMFATNCAACHQATGEGLPGAFPALADSAFVQGNADEVLRLILNGRAGMPAYGGSLDNRQIALIVSYIRNAWANEAHPVDASMVETVRGGGDLELEPTTPTTRPGAGN